MDNEKYCDHSYYLQPNTLPETEGSYHGVYVANGSSTLDDVGANIEASKANVSKGTVKLVIRSMFGKVAELVSSRLCRVSAGPVSFEAAIGGTVPYANSALGDENELYIAIRLQDQLRNAASGITPKRINATAANAVLDGVADVASGKKSCVSGTDPFLSIGLRISATGPGESLAVVDKDGVSHDAEVVAEEHGQRITARLSEALPPGQGRVVLTTRGYLTPDAELQTYSKAVTIVAGETPPGPADPPEITRVQSDNEPEGTVNIGGAFLEVSGLNIQDATEVKLYNSHGTLLDTIPMERHEERADTIRSTRSVTVEYTPEGGVETGSLTVTTAGGSDSHAVTLVSH